MQKEKKNQPENLSGNIKPTKMQVAYICHPISGDVRGNLKKIREIVRHINLTEPNVVPFVPYYADLVSLDDNIPAERERGIKNDTELLSRGFIDELRLYGNRISAGMMAETELAFEKGIVVLPMTQETKKEYGEKFNFTA